MVATTHSEASSFAVYYDDGLSRPTPYSGANNYLRMAKPRLDRTYALVQAEISCSHIVDVGASPFYLLDRALEGGAAHASGLFFANDSHPLKDADRIFTRNGKIDLFHRNIEDEDWPFDDDSVDIITACEILEHCEHFPLRFCNEVRRVLRPHGLLLITVPNVASIGNIVKLILGKNIYMKYRSDPTGRHKHEYTMGQLRELVSFMDLDEIETGYLPFVTSAKTWPRAAYHAISALPGLRRYAPKLYILARQPEKKSRDPLTLPPKALYVQDMSIED